MNTMYGVDIGGTNVKLAVVNEAGDILHRGMIPTEPSSGPRKTASRVAEWFEEQGPLPGDVTGAGVGCAGLINHQEGLLYSSPNLPGWEGARLMEIFREELSLPVTIDNDANCAAYGEYFFGAGKGYDNFVCITLGTGVGGGIIIDGNLYRGEFGQAGELGHTKVVAGGELCSCGSRGCLEAYIKAEAIVERALGMIENGDASVLSEKERVTVKDISEAAGSGDEVAAEALRITGWYLGIGLSNVAHLINPGAIAVGGGVAMAGRHIMGPATDSLSEHVMNEIFMNVSIVPAELGNSASSIGAAMLASEKS
ncbi:MAG: ROK family protein [Candidatus Krumholzibacteriales bacterium]